MNNQVIPEHILELTRFREDIFYMIWKIWGLTMQPCKPEYKDKWRIVRESRGEDWEVLRKEVSAEWFGDFNEKTNRWEYHNFVKGKHITWQQCLTLLAVRKAQNGYAKRHISIVSGHGTGKSTTISWILIWFLVCFHNSQIAATAPTSNQMHDVLWKECQLWIHKMKDETIKNMIEWQTGHIRMKIDPNVWFARAKTASKENTEALAGIHADHVLLLADEASGISEQVFNTAEGALTSGSVFVILISNGTRTIGYFYDSHHKNRDDWQDFSYNGEESPMVDYKYVERQAKRHGIESDEYAIRVKGGFPRTDAMDDSGYYQLTPADKVIIKPTPKDIESIYWFGRVILGIDPAGEGKDKASFVLRDRFKAYCLLELQTSNSRLISMHALQFIEKYNVKEHDVVIDAFGVGADVSKEIAIATKGKFDAYSMLVGNKPKDEEKYNGHLFRRKPDEVDDPTKRTEEQKDMYLNIRALLHARLSKWCIQGGEILDHNTENSDFKEQLTGIKAKRSLQGNQIQLMPKKEAQKLRIPSPNKADALALTFARDIDDVPIYENDLESGENDIDDRYALL
jgi:hypothetical protein